MTFPPGRARLQRDLPRPGPTVTITMGIVLVAFLAARIRLPSCYYDDISLGRTNSATSSGARSSFPPVSILNDDVLSLYIAKLAQREPNGLGTGDSEDDESDNRYPIRGTFFGCCA